MSNSEQIAVMAHFNEGFRAGVIACISIGSIVVSILIPSVYIVSYYSALKEMEQKAILSGIAHYEADDNGNPVLIFKVKPEANPK